MLGNMWHPSNYAAENLGTTEIRLAYLRENGVLKPGLHWKSSPYGQKKPWNPEVLFNTKLCKQIVEKYFSEKQFDREAA